ncbi:MAG: hypothetical protein ACOH2E_04895 [Candidatus Paracaedibacter sp.]
MAISYQQICKNKIIYTALKMKNGELDTIVGLRSIYALWTDAGFEENEIYNALNLIDSETDQIIKGDIQKNFSKEFLEAQIEFEEEYLKEEQAFIDKLIEELCQIPIVEEEEGPHMSISV